MNPQIFRPGSLFMLTPAPDHMICTPGIEIAVRAPDDVCEPGCAQWSANLVMGFKVPLLCLNNSQLLQVVQVPY